jgi:hypothetical protein
MAFSMAATIDGQEAIDPMPDGPAGRSPPRAHLLARHVAEDVAVPMNHAALPPGLGEVLGSTLDQAQAGIRDDELDARQAALLEVAEEARPALAVLLGTFADAQDLAEAFGRHADRHQQRHVADLAGPLIAPRSTA